MKFNLSGQRAYPVSYLFVATFVLYGLFLYYSQQSLLNDITRAKLVGLKQYSAQRQQEEVSHLKGRADSIAATIAKLSSAQLENIQSYGLQKEGLAATLEPFMDYPEIAGIEIAGIGGLACAAMWRNGGQIEFRTDYALPAAFTSRRFVVRKEAVTAAGVQGTIAIYVDDSSVSKASARIRDELQRSAVDEVARLEGHFRRTLLPQVAVLACGIIFFLLSSRVIARSYSLIARQREELEVFNRQLEQRVAERTAELSTALALIDATLEATTDGVAALDGEGKLTCFNDNFLRMWQLRREKADDSGYLLEAVLGQLKDREGAVSRVQYLRSHPEADSMEVRELKDGRIFEEYTRPQRVGGRSVGRVWSYRDVTERVRAERALRETQSELLAASRKAGMAEIATNVLHNVGNVLNSVNVSASVASQRLQESKVGALEKVVRLIKEHAGDLAHYLTEDEKGKLLPHYLESVCRALAAERSEVLEELALLSGSVDHIKEIVATQQSYAGSFSIIERVSIHDLVQDALRMKDSELVRHQVSVVQEVEGVPPLPLDRTRVLQILVNLIGNASQAMAGPGDTGTGRQMTVRAVLAEHEALRISVQDEGEGIAPENLTRIFNHGFTTRRDGHGFGLHSCAIVAKGMGGALTARSDGPGKGATFTLELPIRR